MVSLVHAVLTLEQMLTTGGGWQDQVGGLVGLGSPAQVGRSAPALPLRVTVDSVPLGDAFREALEARLVLIFTGQPRLAKHLLVEVLRRWWSSPASPAPTSAAAASGSSTSASPPASASAPAPTSSSVASRGGVGRAMAALVANAEACAASLAAGDLKGLGRCLADYHELKRTMVGMPAYEPPYIANLAASLRPRSHGLALCGAGGGGFLAVLLKDPYDDRATDAAAATSSDSSSGSGSRSGVNWRAVNDAAAQAGGSVHRAGLVSTGLVIDMS